MNAGSYWLDPKNNDVLVYEGYSPRKGVIFYFWRLLDPKYRRALREDELRSFRPLTEMEALAWTAK
jgi:hypothetical protein